MRISFFGFLFAATSAFAQPDGRTYVDLVHDLGESRIALAEHMLKSSADFLASDPDMGASAGHRGLKQIIGEGSPFRSILAIDQNGQLMFDSYNWGLFTLAKDLGEREYFRGTTDVEPKELVIFKPVVGKQSGQFFVPLTMAVPNGTGRDQSVVVLTAPPEAFVPERDVCAFCGVMLLKGGEVLASTRPMSDVNADVASRMQFDGEYGAKTIEVRGMSVTVHWRKSAKTEIVYCYYEASPLG